MHQSMHQSMRDNPVNLFGLCDDEHELFPLLHVSLTNQSHI